MIVLTQRRELSPFAKIGMLTVQRRIARAVLVELHAESAGLRRRLLAIDREAQHYAPIPLRCSRLITIQRQRLAAEDSNKTP